jgi:ubiquinone/menaquinone biosynthesis C-methylase UbiE
MTAAKLRDMDRSTVHELTPRQNCADRGRQAFVFHVKRALGSFGATGLRAVAARKTGTDDPGFTESAAVLRSSRSFAAWSALNKGSQRRMWLALEDMVDRQLPALQAKAAEIADREPAGSLELDDDFKMPSHLASVAFHGQPGGYIRTSHDLDIRAGLMQEAGGALYTRGAGTGKHDSKAQAVVRYLREQFPQLEPRRILDLGCGHGAQTCGYAVAWPQAKTYGVDAGSAQLRFAHLRAESLGVPLHLRQRDVASTGFPDGYFDLVVSNILLHEVPTPVMHEVMRECYRLLAPHGVCIHQDVPTQNPEMPGFQKYLAMWQTRHNDEPFWQDFSDSSVPAALLDAGFAAESTFEAYVPQVDGPLTWYFVGAQRR